MNGARSERALVLAPVGRDAPVAAQMLRESEIEAEVVADLPALVEQMRAGAGFAVITEEALSGADLRALAATLDEQPEWSDLPFILLTVRGGGLERNPAAQRFLATLGNVTFLERPFHPTTLVSLCRAALRARRRQYDARARLEKLRQAEEELRIALSAGRLGAWTLDVASGALESSLTCKANFGRSAEDSFTYEDLLAAVHPEDLARMQAAVAESIGNAADYDIEYRALWPDGSEHWVHVAGRPSYSAEGMPLRMTGVSQEVTERRRAEEVLRESNVELEQRVDQRTRERAEAVAQLHEAQKLETIGQLTGGVAHDFNNLLTPIVGGLDMLRRMHSDDRSRRVIGGALQAAERAGTLVARLLAFARRQNLEARPVDTAALVHGVLDLIQRSLGPQIQVALEIADKVPAALVDPNQLELALLNLAVNARDAMPEGGALRIAITTELRPDWSELDPGVYVRLAVTDTGTGMDAETLKRAIEPFYSTKGIGKGTGLGLSMVHGLAAQSGGTMRLISAPGQGTTVELWLPATEAQATTAQLSHDDVIPAVEPLRILLVDDEDLVRRGTADMLASLGHHVTDIASAELALAALANGGFDLLISDYLMPAIDGLDLIGRAREMRPELPALLITGFADFPEGAGAGIARLAKPFRQAQLAGLVARVVREG